MATPRLSVVLPAFQAGARVGESVHRVRSDLAHLHGAGDLQIIVADDGSTDETVEEARRAGADHVVVNARNLGKGAAVKTGVTAADGRTVAFTDVDLSYPPAQIERLMERVEAGIPVVVGSRWSTESSASTPASAGRKINSRLFNLATRLTVGVWRDTQCGLKAFDGEIAKELFRRVRQDGFAFDVEIFLAAAAMGLEVEEVPVRLEEGDGTTVHLRGQVSAVMDLMRIRARLRRGGYAAAAGEAANGSS